MKRKLYIAHFAGEGPVNVILAPDQQTATVYWQGMGLHPSQVEEIDPDDGNAFAVIAVVGTRNLRISDLRERRWGTSQDHLHLMVRGRGEEPLS